MDKECVKVKCAIDINPTKQHKYICDTWHYYIIKPEELTKLKIKNVIVMNNNYIEEIKSNTDLLNINLKTLEFNGMNFIEYFREEVSCSY